MNANPTPPPLANEPPLLRRKKLNWVLFFGALLGPVLLTSLSVLLIGNKTDLAPGIGFFGGALGGIGAGVILGIHVGRTSSARAGLSVLFALIFAVVSVTMSAFGCLASGYKLQF